MNHSNPPNLPRRTKKCPKRLTPPLPGGAVTNFPCKLRLIFFLRPGGAGAPTAPLGYAYGRGTGSWPGPRTSHTLNTPLIDTSATPTVCIVAEWRRPRGRAAPSGARVARALTLAGTLDLAETQSAARHFARQARRQRSDA